MLELPQNFAHKKYLKFFQTRDKCATAACRAGYHRTGPHPVGWGPPYSDTSAYESRLSEFAQTNVPLHPVWISLKFFKTFLTTG
ncbi:hypothetical protein LEP1GSC050_0639 [Leptospira broomii serovar Hurstbridge str. 5399]|uniref:Uncharacterized protein n=1 Tax=Leptospira broomii serovar Hurstbridge str. 5399 TaxID=1049789 RepID=T0FI93_9LEPT|nr:hypothetical protein LEP1GSC050_0639 [Leptospira broomii serovar Hurstbridge str. 5399]